MNAISKRVLIADDSSVVRGIIRTFLQQRTNVDICGEAANGLEAIEKAKSLKPDLILLDLAMPELNGAEAASILKNTMPDVPIILFTMYSEDIGHTLASAVGIDMVLCKPDGMGQLVDSVKSLLGREPELLATGDSATAAAAAPDPLTKKAPSDPASSN
jgi:DNA-binding NarL/FixJ family response regulator